MKKRIIVLASLLSVIVIGGTFGAFAWWDSLEKTQDETLTIGKGVQLVVSVNTGSEDFEGQRLIPASAVKKPGDVYEFVLDYTVNLDSETVEDLKLNVSVVNLKVGGNATYANKINVVIKYLDGESWVVLDSNNYPTINAGDNSAQVQAVISLGEIENETEYNAIANKNITFDLVFLATEQ